MGLLPQSVARRSETIPTARRHTPRGRVKGVQCGRLTRIMASPQSSARASEVLGKVTLVTGPEEVLNQRNVDAAVRAVRAADPESEVSETTADQVSMAVLGDLAAPYLFSSVRCGIVRRLQDLPEEAYDGWVEYAGDPAEDIGLVLVHSGGQKGSGLLT